MAANIEDQLSQSSFEVNSYIRSVATRYDNSDDLLKHKKQIQSVAEKTAQKLKQNVYQNYALFIDTSREISALEAEMYQLSHLLNEHQGLTSTIQVAPSSTSEEDQATPHNKVPDIPTELQSIASLLETVEGSAVVTDVPGRCVVHASNLLEYESQKLEPLESIRAFLLNDSLLLATHIKIKRKGPVRYHFQALYELDNLAVVNLKDTDKARHLFQIRMFPDSHTFQAENEASKAQWIRLIQVTKQLLANERQTVKQFEVTSKKLGSRRPKDKGAILLRQVTEVSSPQWIKDAPENLDVFIAQREFEQAVDLIDKVKGYLKEGSDHIIFRNTRARVNHRVNLLSEVLMKELQLSPSGSLRGGPRSARKAITLLLRLGRASKACELFLANHSRINDHELKQIKLEGATTIYITNVSSSFFASLLNAATEFSEAFKNNSSSFSSFVTWSVKELDIFLKQYCIESIFPPVKSNLNFTMVVDCVMIIRTECRQVVQWGLDLDFKIMSLLHGYLSKALINGRELLEEKLTVLGDTDTWDPMDCRQNQAKVAQIILQLANIGVPNPSNLVSDHIVDLSKTTFTGCELILNYVECYMRIHTPELLEIFADCLCDLFRHMISIITKAMEDQALLPKTDFLVKNAELLILSALPALAIKIQKIIHQDIPDLVGLQGELKDLLDLVKSGMPPPQDDEYSEDDDEEEREESEDESSDEDGLV